MRVQQDLAKLASFESAFASLGSGFLTDLLQCCQAQNPCISTF